MCRMLVLQALHNLTLDAHRYKPRQHSRHRMAVALALMCVPAARLSSQVVRLEGITSEIITS